jgi:hypothetical protein
MAFFTIMFSGDDCEPYVYREILKKSPAYLIEKFERYILSNSPDHNWGIHPGTRHSFFDAYCKQWKIGIEPNDKQDYKDNS